MAARNKWLQILMSDVERDVVDEVAEFYGMDASNLVRQALNYVRVTKPLITAYPLLIPEEEKRQTEETRWLQVRMTDEERDEADRLADTYGLDTSKFVRKVIAYLRAVKPNPIIIPDAEGKAVALPVEADGDLVLV